MVIPTVTPAMVTTVMAVMAVIIIRERIPDHPCCQGPQRRPFRGDRLHRVALRIIGGRATRPHQE